MKRLHIHFSIFALGIVMLVLAGTACGPTQEEIMAKDKARLEAEARRKSKAEARRQAEEARRQAEEATRQAQKARVERIRASEVAGDEAARQGQFEKALAHYQEVLRNVERYSDQDQRVRQMTIKVVQTMPKPPLLPESALRSMVRGETRVKMGGADSYEAASKEMEQAVLAAPWWADGYYNLGIVQEKAGMLKEAMQNLRLYLLAAPQSTGSGSVQAKIYQIEVIKEEQEKWQRLQGSWRSDLYYAEYKVSIGSDSLRAEAKTPPLYSIQVQKKGRTLEGFINIPSYRNQECDIPGETNPVSGTISEDGHSIVFRFAQSEYKASFQRRDTSFFSLSSPWDYVCGGVVLLGRTERTIKLTRK